MWWHGAALHCGSMGRQWHPCLPMTCRHKGTQCIAAPYCPNGISTHIQERQADSKLVAMGRWHDMAASGNALGRQCIKHPAFTNSALTGASQLTGIKNNKNVSFTVAAKQLSANIKNLALTNLAFTGGSHFAQIPKSSNATFWQLHWRQNNLVKISKIRHSQT